MKKATLKDVIKLAGVSLRTGSRVINNDPTVRPATREKVVDAMAKLGYTPDVTARTLRGAKSFMIGVTYDNLNAYYIRDLLTGVLKVCQESGYGLQIVPCDSGGPDVIQKLRQNIQYSRLAGLVMSPPLSEMPEITDALLSDGTRLALITSGPAEDQISSPTVFFDDFGGAHAITSYVISLGHRKIGFIWGDKSHKTSHGRYNGYAAALAEHNIALDPSLILEGQYTFECGFEKTTRMLQANPEVTAIFASNDEMAAGAIAAARNLDLKVPDDLSVAGFEDSPFAKQTWPHLTTARLPTTEIAEASAKMLIQELRPNSISKGRTFKTKVIYSQPIIRDSTAKIAGSAPFNHRGRCFPYS